MCLSGLVREIRRERVIGALPLFDPETGEIVFEPERREVGYWSGCPSVLYEPDSERFLLTYRQRRPRGEARTDRGWRCALAESKDGRHFQDVWSVEKTQLGSPSMERFSLLPRSDEGYELYISYVDPADNRWRIDVLSAKSPSQFAIEERRSALTAAATGTEGVKDPYTLRVGPAVFMFVSFAKRGVLSDEEKKLAHATGDIYNVGLTTFPTGLATRLSGQEVFRWHGEALGVGDTWDRYQARLTSLVSRDGVFLAFYDGSASVEENYEERSGVAVGFDVCSLMRLTDDAPWLRGDSAGSSVRYVDVVQVGSEWFVYYEYGCADGSHELRLARIPV